jgi:hypothetical protein
MMAAAGAVLQESHVAGIRSPPSKLSCCMCEDVEITVPAAHDFAAEEDR